jgi:hypothetical protein
MAQLVEMALQFALDGSEIRHSRNVRKPISHRFFVASVVCGTRKSGCARFSFY